MGWEWRAIVGIGEGGGGGSKVPDYFGEDGGCVVGDWGFGGILVGGGCLSGGRGGGVVLW